MFYINNRDILDQTLNFAIEEYALTHLDIDETYLMFYRMTPTVIVGRNQNTLEEINSDYIRTHRIAVTRRLSGGGAVFNDPGNLSFSFITKDDGDSFNNYRKFTEPVIQALRKLGVQAQLSGRNDLLVDGKKISGNAQFVTKGRIFSHGTLLFDVDLDHVAEALDPDAEKYQSKGIQSVRSRVTNIREHLERDLDIHQFRQILLDSIFGGAQNIREYAFTDQDWTNIVTIARERYRNWDWVYGKSPEFNVRKACRFPAGRIDLRLNIRKGRVEGAAFYGDFFGQKPPAEFAEKLKGVRYERDAIEAALDPVDLSVYFGAISKENLLSVFF